MQFPQAPSAQSSLEVSAYSEPLCSTQPGQLHSTPQVQPEPAREAISSMGGMKPKSGTASVGREGEEVEKRNGGNSGPGALSWVCLARLCDRDGVGRLVHLRDIAVVLGSTEQHSSATCARVASPVDVATEDGCFRHLHFQAGFLHEQGLRRTSTLCRELEAEGAARITSLIPLGSAGAIGTNLGVFVPGGFGGFSSCGLQVHLE